MARVLNGNLLDVLLHAGLVDLHIRGVLEQRHESALHAVLHLFHLLRLNLLVLLVVLIDKVEHLDALFVASDDLRVRSLHKVQQLVLNGRLDLEVAVDLERLRVNLP